MLTHLICLSILVARVASEFLSTRLIHDLGEVDSESPIARPAHPIYDDVRLGKSSTNEVKSRLIPVPECRTEPCNTGRRQTTSVSSQPGTDVPLNPPPIPRFFIRAGPRSGKGKEHRSYHIETQPKTDVIPSRTSNLPVFLKEDPQARSYLEQDSSSQTLDHSHELPEIHQFVIYPGPSPCSKNDCFVAV